MMEASACLPNQESTTTLEHGKLCSYSPAPWIANLKNVPAVIVPLAMTPTPIHKWNLPGAPQNLQVYIKRDDLTGCALSGNKVRKLELAFGDILQNGCKHVITTGSSLQSNHCRATAVAAARLGIQSHLLLCSESTEIKSSNGNLFLSRMCDANIYLIPPLKSIDDILQRQRCLTEEIYKKTGEKAYDLYPGGADNITLFGYFNAWQEMIEQGVLEDFDDVVVACATGGTVASLAIGNYVTGQKVKVHGIAVFDNVKSLHLHINGSLAAVGLSEVKSEDIADIIEGHKDVGLTQSSSEEFNLYKTIASTSGIFCDPVFTGKGVKGLISELNSNPGRFKGQRILFVHTGGIFGLYDGRMFDIFSNEKVHDWHNIEMSPGDFL